MLNAVATETLVLFACVWSRVDPLATVLMVAPDVHA